MRALGVDFGGARIGLAVMDRETGIGRALPALPSAGTLAKDARGIAAIAHREEAVLAVVGLPLSHGEETAMSRICRRLGNELSKLGLQVEYTDESLTSHEVEDHLRGFGLKASEIRKRVDGEAALKILNRWRAGEEGS